MTENYPLNVFLLWVTSARFLEQRLSQVRINLCIGCRDAQVVYTFAPPCKRHRATILERRLHTKPNLTNTLLIRISGSKRYKCQIPKLAVVSTISLIIK